MFDPRKELPVMEHFYTVQGEGFHSGRAAYFIRLAGCDVGCVWCDVKESWSVDAHPIIPIETLVRCVVAKKATFCVITGGEPARNDLTELIGQLQQHNIYTAIETSGTSPLLGEIDWYCFSPKKFKQPLPEAYQKANELKIVVYHPSDFQWAESHAQRINNACKLFLQPEWSKQQRFLPQIIDYVKENPKWCVSLQTHKFMDIP